MIISPLKISLTESENCEGVIAQLDSNIFSFFANFFSMHILMGIKNHGEKYLLMLSRSSQIVFHNAIESFVQLERSAPIQD